MTAHISIISWNINSVRFRLELVKKFIDEYQPDIICFQETKSPDDKFPSGPFRQWGYNFQEINGQPMHHGVAILSRIPLHDPVRYDWQDNGEARHIGVSIKGAGGTSCRIENVYIPAGGDVPNRDDNPKFGQKLDFLTRMTKWADDLDTPTILLGDFNIAPLESDVWSHKQLINVVSHTAIEIDHLDKLQAAHDWVDLGRHFHPAPKRLYTWWSYRARDWAKSDRGRRLDHVWVSPELKDKAVSHEVAEPVRGWTKPSDHAPLITRFAL